MDDWYNLFRIRKTVLCKHYRDCPPWANFRWMLIAYWVDCLFIYLETLICKALWSDSLLNGYTQHLTLTDCIVALWWLKQKHIHNFLLLVREVKILYISSVKYIIFLQHFGVLTLYLVCLITNVTWGYTNRPGTGHEIWKMALYAYVSAILNC